ncbi:MAG TPA: NADP-dependent oxidoreductase [Candidatus Cybelea sp.]|jgi:NADPH:quinone reductase-like Zn-dependent oxidoreductase|nr:NADP-dependent oxidoreductase [Candidatus Cybelea sp.]
MQAVVVEHRGETGSLREVPVPNPAPNEILVRVTAAGVNPIDWKMRDRDDRRFPFVLGQDFAGVVSATGNRVTKYREGERIFGMSRDHGSYAQYTLVPEEDRVQPVCKIADGVGDADAAALPTAGLTALAAVDALHVVNGTTLLVLGATGGVGGYAVQMAHDRGARVIGSGAAASEAYARSLGVDEFVAYDRDDVAAAVKAAHPQGVDAALDLVDDEENAKKLGDVIRAGGTIVSTIGAIDENWFSQRKIAGINLVVFKTLESSHAGLRTLLELVEQGRIRVTIAAERPLSEAVEALEDSKRGRVNGKIVITVA